MRRVEPASGGQTADLVDGEVDTALEIDEGVISPDLLVNLFAGNDLTSALHEQQQDSKLLRLKLEHMAALTQLTIRRVDFEWTEANGDRLGSWRDHTNTALQVFACMLRHFGGF